MKILKTKLITFFQNLVGAHKEKKKLPRIRYYYPMYYPKHDPMYGIIVAQYHTNLLFLSHRKSTRYLKQNIYYYRNHKFIATHKKVTYNAKTKQLIIEIFLVKKNLSKNLNWIEFKNYRIFPETMKTKN